MYSPDSISMMAVLAAIEDLRGVHVSGQAEVCEVPDAIRLCALGYLQVVADDSRLRVMLTPHGRAAIRRVRGAA